MTGVTDMVQRLQVQDHLRRKYYVTIMYGMFWGAASFNQPTNMSHMFTRTPQPSTNPLAIGMLAKSPTWRICSNQQKTSIKTLAIGILLP